MRVKALAQAVYLAVALASKNRVLILEALSKDSLGVSDIQKKVKGWESSLSVHLAVLRSAGLVTMKKDGKRHIYTIKPFFWANYKFFMNMEGIEL